MPQSWPWSSPGEPEDRALEPEGGPPEPEDVLAGPESDEPAPRQADPEAADATAGSVLPPHAAPPAAHDERTALASEAADEPDHPEPHEEPFEPAQIPGTGDWGADVASALRAPGTQDQRDLLRPGGGPAMRRPARVVAMANQKGGVGKTTTTINLGAGLAEHGSRVLLVDMDPQGSLGVGLGADPHNLELTIYNLLMQGEASVDQTILETKVPNLHLLPANIDLAAAELLLVQEVAREQALRRVVERVQYRYDFILIDCPPSLGLLTINGLTAAEGVIVPLECEYFALRGMSLLMQTLDKVRARLNPTLKLEGIIATMFDGRTIHSREVLERVREAFGDLVYKTTINKTIRFAEAPVAGEPILTYSPRSKGSDAYRDLAKEVLAREPSS